MLIKGTALVSSRLESEIDIEEEGLEVADKEVVAQLSKGTLRREHSSTNNKLSSRLSSLTFLKVDPSCTTVSRVCVTNIAVARQATKRGLKAAFEDAWQPFQMSSFSENTLSKLFVSDTGFAQVCQVKVPRVRYSPRRSCESTTHTSCRASTQRERVSTAPTLTPCCRGSPGAKSSPSTIK